MLGSTALSPVPGARDPKLAERIAAAIEADVLRAGWPVGMVIGSEDQLTVRYGVGRAVIREAVRLSEHRQVVRMRRGRGGGLVVVEPDVSAVTESLGIFLEFVRANADDLIEARVVLEGFAAAAAARRSVGASQIQALRQLAQEIPACADAPADSRARRFHELVADSTGNAALSLFIRAIASLTEQLVTGAGAEEGWRRPHGRPVDGRHVALVEAIAAGDSKEARELAIADMALLRESVRELASRPSKRDRGGGSSAAGVSAAGDSAAGVSAADASAADASAADVSAAGAFAAGSSPAGPGMVSHRQRPADLVAARIRRDIIDRGWPVGESLGFEADLMQRYGIGRAQFREAIRILENHSVVRMQRGAAGGMLVAVPDGRAIVRAVSLYLTYQGMNTADIRDLRTELETATLQLTIERLTDDGIRRLKSLLELERTWPDDDFPAVSHDLHAVIAELSGNRTLGLLQSIAMQLTAERLHSGDPSRVTEPPDAVRRAHHAIVQAIIARDIPLALRRMEKHLRAVAHWTRESTSSRR
jgi:DNA-binding FadR family transcriptional regulator